LLNTRTTADSLVGGSGNSYLLLAAIWERHVQQTNADKKQEKAEKPCARSTTSAVKYPQSGFEKIL